MLRAPPVRDTREEGSNVAKEEGEGRRDHQPERRAERDRRAAAIAFDVGLDGDEYDDINDQHDQGDEPGWKGTLRQWNERLRGVS